MKSKLSLVVFLVAVVAVGLAAIEPSRGQGSFDSIAAGKARRIRSYHVQFDVVGRERAEVIVIPEVEGKNGFILTDIAVVTRLRQCSGDPLAVAIREGDREVFRPFVSTRPGSDRFASTVVNSFESGIPLRPGSEIICDLLPIADNTIYVTLSGYVY